MLNILLVSSNRIDEMIRPLQYVVSNIDVIKIDLNSKFGKYLYLIKTLYKKFSNNKRYVVLTDLSDGLGFIVFFFAKLYGIPSVIRMRGKRREEFLVKFYQYFNNSNFFFSVKRVYIFSNE